jgi:hypothetical protein
MSSRVCHVDEHAAARPTAQTGDDVNSGSIGSQCQLRLGFGIVKCFRQSQSFEIGLEFLFERPVVIAKRKPSQTPQALGQRIAGLDPIQHLRIKPPLHDAFAVAARL